MSATPPGSQARSAAAENNAGGSIAFFEVGWTESIQFSGAPVGTPIQVVLGFSLHDGVGGDMPVINGAGILLTASAGDPIDGFELRLADDGNHNFDNQEVYQTVNALVGYPLTIGETLDARSNTFIVDGCAELPHVCASPEGDAFTPDSVFVQSYNDAFDTANFSLQILTPGVTYVADSGTIYPTTLPPEGGDPVPEPAGFALFGVGLFGLGFIRHRKRRHRACL